MEKNILNLRAFILIADDPSKIDAHNKLYNYEFFSSAQLIQKIMLNVFNVKQSDIITLAYGKESNYRKLVEKTQQKIITLINQDDVLYQKPSDITCYRYFEKPGNLIRYIIDESEIQNANIFLFLLNNESDEDINNISYIQIYQAILESHPNSLRIFNYCCNNGSLLPSIQKYSQIYQIIHTLKESKDKIDCFDARFVPLYISIAFSIGIDLFFEKIDWITQYFMKIQLKQLDSIELFLEDMKTMIKSNVLLFENPNLPIMEYIDNRFHQLANIKQLKLAANKMLILTSGDLMACVATVYYLSTLFSKEIKLSKVKSLINQNNTNIFIHICDDNKKTEINFLRNLKVNYKSIYPPVKDLQIFPCSGIYGRSFTSVSIQINPQVKVICRSHGICEIIHELFLHIANKPNFHRLKVEETTAKDKFKKFPVMLPETNGKHHVSWTRLFPKNISDPKQRNDCLLSIVQSNFIKKVASMRGIKQLVCDDIERIKQQLNDNIIENSSIPNAVQKSPNKTQKEIWKEKTANTRISENEIRRISAFSLISILSSQIPFEESLAIIQKNFHEEQSVIILMAILSGRNHLEAGLISISAMIELKNVADSILQHHGINPTSASRAVNINQSNKIYLMILSGIAALIRFNRIIDFTSSIEKVKTCQSFMISKLYETTHEKLIKKGIDEIHQLISNELISATTSLKDLVNSSINTLNDSFNILVNLPTQNFSGKILDDSELEKAILKKFGSFIFAKDAILSVVYNPVMQIPNLTKEVLDLISDKILEIRNICMKGIINLIGKNANSEIYEVIASHLIEEYSGKEMEKNIARIVAYKLQERILNFTISPRNWEDIDTVISIYPNKYEKVIFLLRDTLTEISEVIFKEFQFAEANHDNHNGGVDEASHWPTPVSTYEKQQYYEINNEERSNNDSFEEELNKIDKNKEEIEIRTIVMIFKKNHPYLGIIALIEIISSYYLQDNPITIPIINIMKEVIHEVPEGVNLTITENDILQFSGLGIFGIEETDVHKRGRSRKTKSQELAVSSKTDADEIKFPIEDEEYYSDEGLFKINLPEDQHVKKEEENEEIGKLSEEEIQKYQDEILGNSKRGYEKELWLVFKKLFTERIKNKMGLSINLDYPTSIGICGSDKYEKSLQKIFKIVPLSYIYDFWTFKKYIGEFATLHNEKKVIKYMIQSFDDADQIVTPRHFKDRKRYSDR
ncbi:hypothetical protein TRFO_21083 [Tritrichomonas foetus]|uniref:Uncharacterized protein n=1 Tax=Tritrichomonas foetus TaxID=1144522 RepID=A0A1J4KFK4_9EUKA|nr:hypothetical protein TRFO_21083 [Tritrichomonas foetus]|eukprot:OHT09818.1 hypothetical protein TRFO_21083 [Tritrichomonas foetus]